VISLIHGQLIAGQLIAWTHKFVRTINRVSLNRGHIIAFIIIELSELLVVTRKPTANRAATFEIRIDSIKLDRTRITTVEHCREKEILDTLLE